MCQKNDLPLSLKSNTFNCFCADFDSILRQTLRGMVETDQEVAEINCKMKITLTDDSAPDFSVRNQTREITKPKFDHTITAVIQRKDKKSGSLSGPYELVWDRDIGDYVMRPIDNGQIDLFEDNDEKPEQKELVGLPAPEEDDDEDEGTGISPFEWVNQFVGQKLRVVENMGIYTVRAESNTVVLSSGCSEQNPFYCPAEKLESHVDHEVVCVMYGDGANISIECEDCGVVIFDIDAPPAEEEAPEIADNIIDADFTVVEESAAEEDPADYQYEAPEE